MRIQENTGVKSHIWFCTVLGAMNMKAGGILLIAGCILVVLMLPFVYGKIYKKYSK